MRKVLIIAGGGCFGLVPARFLAETGISINRVQVFGGTSIGGILSLMYAGGKPPVMVLSTFREMMDKVFVPTWWGRWISGPRYPAEPLESALKKAVPGNLKCIGPKVVITSMDFTAGKPKIWDNLVDRDDMDTQLWQIGRATSAAPTYFPSMIINDHAYIDGGVVENIPIVTTCCALRDKLGVPFSDMDVFVLGTGWRKPEYHNPKHVAEWGMAKWAKPLVGMITGANESGSPFWGRQLGLGALEIFNPVVLDSDWGMDDVKAGKAAEKRAEPYIPEFRDKFNAWINR